MKKGLGEKNRTSFIKFNVSIMRFGKDQRKDIILL